MREIIYSIIGGLIITVVIFYLRVRGVKLDSKEVEKIKKEIHAKPIGDVVSTINEWLS